MRILVKLMTQSERLPYDYRRIIISFFKKILSEIADGKYYDKYYSNAKRRLFTWAVHLPLPKFENGEIKLSKNEFNLIFSTGDSMTGYIFMSAFIAQKGKSFPAPLGNSFTVKSVAQLPEKSVSTNTAMIKFKSPLCLRKHIKETNSDIYYSIASEDFQNRASEIIRDQLEYEGFSGSIIDGIKLIPINAKKTVVKNYNCFVECSVGDFVIEADKAIINYFLQYGIGSRKSAGFGFAELIAEGV